MYQLNKAYMSSALYCLAIFIVCYILYIFISITIGKWIKTHTSKQFYNLFKKTVLYTLFSLATIISLNHLGFKLTTLLGAAGIFGIAIGFASQTSISNIISGIFLISEKPFQIGDIVEFESIIGTVYSIDLLSVKIIQFDNKIVRIPNEAIIKNKIINFTKYPVRRMDFEIGVAYKESPEKVMQLLLEIADNNPLVLDEPEPFVLFKNFGDSALELQFSIWFHKDDFRDVKNTLMCEIKSQFDSENIEIPFPHRTLYMGSQTPPVEFKMLSEKP